MKVPPIRSRATLVAAVVSAGLVLAVGQAVPAQAGPSAGVSLSKVDSGCSSTADGTPLSWTGANVNAAYASSSWPRGTVRFCADLYQMADTNSTYDWYMIYASSAYTLTGGTRSLAAPGKQSVTSNTTASSGDYEATGSYTSNESCNTSFQVSIAAGPFEVAVTPKLCSGYAVKRSSITSTGAAWTIAKVGGAGSVQTVYYQRVKAGAKPQFTVTWTRPTYTHVWYADLYWKETSATRAYSLTIGD